MKVCTLQKMVLQLLNMVKVIDVEAQQITTHQNEGPANHNLSCQVK
jgi:hypothetical protein